MRVKAEVDTGFPEKGGQRRLSWVWIFYTWTFRSGKNHVVHKQNPSRQNASGQNTSGGQNTGHFMDRKDKMPILSKHLICCTDSQVN